MLALAVAMAGIDLNAIYTYLLHRIYYLRLHPCAES